MLAILAVVNHARSPRFGAQDIRYAPAIVVSTVRPWVERLGRETMEQVAANDIGRIVSVSGSQAVVLLRPSVGPNWDAEGDSAGSALQIGALIKMKTSVSTVYGIVSSLEIPVPARSQYDEELKLVGVELLGEVQFEESRQPGPFRRGVSIFPTLGDAVYPTSKEDLRHIYAPPESSIVRMGTIHQDPDIPAYFRTDDLLGKHFAVLGTTGSGKSCALTIILQGLLEQFPNAHVILLDLHSEYSQTFQGNAEVLSQDSLQLPFWIFTFDELVEVILGQSNEQRSAEVAILAELIPAAKADYLAEFAAGAARSDRPQFRETEQPSVDTPTPYAVSELIRRIDERMGRLDRPDNMASYRRLRARLKGLLADSRYSFMFGSSAARDSFADILARIFRIPVSGRPITILDLSGIPSEILNVVVSVLARITLDFAMWSRRSMPIMLVCEEAHRYAPQDDNSAFEPAKRALSRIAKEGRKYGVSLCVVSQRPSELAAGILSQCNTIFALRLSNQKDRDFVRFATPETGLGLLDFLPSLQNAEAIAVGEGVSVPMRVRFDRLSDDKLPQSHSATFSSAWQRDVDSDDFLTETIELWRKQK